MTEAFVHQGGRPISKLILRVSAGGPWFAEVTYEDDAGTVEGAAQLTIGDRVLRGTFDPIRSGRFGGAHRARIVAGGGGWGKAIKKKNYHNDAGVKARLVSEDAAREVGEQMGDTFSPEAERIGEDYIRGEGVASRVLEETIGAKAWWVDFEGLTQVGERETSEPDPESYEITHYNPESKIASVATQDAFAIVPGAIISDVNTDGPLTVRDVALHITSEYMRAIATCGTLQGKGRAASALARIVESQTAQRLWGKYRYRVTTWTNGRANLQVVSKASGLPDVLPCALWYGVPGIDSELTPGCEVLVEFEEGRRTRPRVTDYQGPGSSAYVPVSLNLCNGTEGAARKGDSVEVALPPLIFSGTIGGEPATGVMVSPVGKTLGGIIVGSSKVKIGG